MKNYLYCACVLSLFFNVIEASQMKKPVDMTEAEYTYTLSHAITVADLNTVTLLLNSAKTSQRIGDILSYKSSNGDTLLHTAVKTAISSTYKNENFYKNSLKIVELLLRFGADVTVMDKLGRTPSDIAQEKKGSQDLLDLLNSDFQRPSSPIDKVMTLTKDLQNFINANKKKVEAFQPPSENLMYSFPANRDSNSPLPALPDDLHTYADMGIADDDSLYEQIMDENSPATQLLEEFNDLATPDEQINFYTTVINSPQDSNASAALYKTIPQEEQQNLKKVILDRISATRNAALNSQSLTTTSSQTGSVVDPTTQQSSSTTTTQPYNGQESSNTLPEPTTQTSTTSSSSTTSTPSLAEEEEYKKLQEEQSGKEPIQTNGQDEPHEG